MPWFRQTPNPRRQTRGLDLPDGGRLRVAGESNYQASIHAACAGRVAPNTDEDDCWDRALPVTVMLRPEPGNSFDANAVRVDALDFGCVGYLFREDAAERQPALLRLESIGVVGLAKAWIVMNRAAGNYAVYMHVADAASVAATIDAVIAYNRRPRGG